MFGKEYFNQRKKQIVFALLVILVGAVFYFTSGAVDKAEIMTNQKVDLSLFEDIQLKAAYNEGTLKIFALAKNNNLHNYKSSIGNSLPENDSIVIGSKEAKMMMDEKLFDSAGDELNDFFGIDTKIEGVLKPTGTFADDFHFVGAEQYAKLEGEPNVLFVKFKDENTPKLFYLYNKNDAPPLKIELSEGDITYFYKQTINGKEYSPLIIGSEEAKMMREEKLFQKTGNTIDDFFGKDVIIVGIIKETNTGLDMIHIVEKDFFNENN